jgi:FkbM family methyltransferase
MPGSGAADEPAQAAPLRQPPRAARDRPERDVTMTRLFYYLSSIPTLLLGVRNWPVMLAVFLRLPVRRPFSVTLRQSGLTFKARSAMDVWIIKESCLDRGYEAASVPVRDGWTVVDIGAGLGDFTVHAARLNPNGTVHAFEPFPESFALLVENVRLNRLENVKLSPCAVGGRPLERLTLYASGEAVQHSTTGQAAQAAAPTFEVACTSLDQIFDERRLTVCDYLKIDCEGAEFEILFNASESTLARIRHLCLEYHDGVTAHTHADLARFLREKGFRVTTQPNPVHRHLGLLHAAAVD